MSDKDYLKRHQKNLEENLRHYNCTDKVSIDNSKPDIFFNMNKLPDGSKLTACYTRDRDADARQRLQIKYRQRQQKSKNH